MNDIPVTILLLLLAFMGCLVGGPNNIITSAVAADLADDPSIKGNNKVNTHHHLGFSFSFLLYVNHAPSPSIIINRLIALAVTIMVR